jgi:hypothetical protein
MLYEHGNISWRDEQLLDFHGGLCSLEVDISTKKTTNSQYIQVFQLHTEIRMWILMA